MAGLQSVQLIGSGGLDEFDIEELSRQNAPYDAYGVGTKMGVSADAPWTDMAYKLVSYNGHPVFKLSTGKASLPGAKQVFRFTENQVLHHDIIGLKEENLEGGLPLLIPVMSNGRIISRLPDLTEIRGRFNDEFKCLDNRYKALKHAGSVPCLSQPRFGESQNAHGTVVRR